MKTFSVTFWERIQCRTVVTASSIEEAQSKAVATFRADCVAGTDHVDGFSEILAFDGADFFEVEEEAL